MVNQGKDTHEEKLSNAWRMFAFRWVIQHAINVSPDKFVNGAE